MDTIVSWEPGRAVALQDGLQVVLAPNPSPMTGPGTNTYILGTKTCAIIDPGPDHADHLAALRAAVGGRSVSHIIVTHSHLDHSAGAATVSETFQAPVFAFGDSSAGRSDVMTRLITDGLTDGGEGVDHSFQPDHFLRDGDVIDGEGWHLDVLHTPGHMGNHIALQWGNALFVGDTVMGWSTSIVSPPDGDMQDFLASCHRLASLPAAIFYPGHGAPIHRPQARVQELISHREARTAAIWQALSHEPTSIEALVREIYTDLAPAVYPAAARNVFAHLIALHTDRRVTATPALRIDANYARTPGL